MYLGVKAGELAEDAEKRQIERIGEDRGIFSARLVENRAQAGIELMLPHFQFDPGQVDVAEVMNRMAFVVPVPGLQKELTVFLRKCAKGQGVQDGELNILLGEKPVKDPKLQGVGRFFQTDGRFGEKQLHFFRIVEQT